MESIEFGVSSSSLCPWSNSRLWGDKEIRGRGQKGTLARTWLDESKSCKRIFEETSIAKGDQGAQALVLKQGVYDGAAYWSGVQGGLLGGASSLV